MISVILAIVSNFILGIIRETGYLGIFFLMAVEAANVPIPSEIIMPFSGFVVGQGLFNFWLVVVFGAFGDLSGSLFSYFLGFLIRKKVLLWDKHKVSAGVERAQRWTERFGDWAIFFSRLVPIVRTFISLPLGVLKTKSIWRFSFFTFIGAFIWSTFLTWLGFTLGKNWQVLQIYFRQFDYLILLLIVIGIIWGLKRHFRRA